MSFALPQVSEDSLPPAWENRQLVQQFLHNVRGAIPLAIEQIDVMLQLIAAAHDRVVRFLDVGCGDGVLSAAILSEYPNARGVAVDFSLPMLAVARRQLHRHEGSVDFVDADFMRRDWIRRVEGYGPFDVIVSGFAIRHSQDDRKREIYRELFNLLGPDGLFLNIEHVASATRWTESVWDDYMIDAIFGALLKSAPGKSRADVAREYYARVRGSTNEPAPLEVQLDWLREIGFENVECYLKVQELAMFGGQKGREVGSKQ